MKNKYAVTIDIVATARVIVEAENEEQALELAKEKGVEIIEESWSPDWDDPHADIEIELL